MVRGEDELADDELVYRRVPTAFAPGGMLAYRAFRPHENDIDGISFVRVALATPEQAARSKTGKPCYLAVLMVGEIRRLDLHVVPDPLPEQPGHSLLPELRAENADEPESRDHQARLLGIVVEVLGPITPDRTLP